MNHMTSHDTSSPSDQILALHFISSRFSFDFLFPRLSFHTAQRDVILWTCVLMPSILHDCTWPSMQSTNSSHHISLWIIGSIQNDHNPHVTSMAGGDCPIKTTPNDWDHWDPGGIFAHSTVVSKDQATQMQSPGLQNGLNLEMSKMYKSKQALSITFFHLHSNSFRQYLSSHIFQN